MIIRTLIAPKHLLHFLVSISAIFRFLRVEALTLPWHPELKLDKNTSCEEADKCSFVDIPLGDILFPNPIFHISIDNVRFPDKVGIFLETKFHTMHNIC